MGRFVAMVVAAFVAAAVNTPLSAQTKTLPIDAFFGTFTGGGIAQNADSVYFALTTRDFDVVIRPVGSGFRIDWTSVIRGGGDPDRPNVRRRKSSKTLRPAASPNVFHCTDSGDPLAGKEMCWARTEKNTLSLFLMTVDRNGIYELQQYDRTLSGNGMQLLFRSWRDGDRLRSVSGQLVKTAQ